MCVCMLHIIVIVMVHCSRRMALPVADVATAKLRSLRFPSFAMWIHQNIIA